MMKKTLLLMLVSAALLSACSNKTEGAATEGGTVTITDASYSFGMWFGSDLKTTGLKFDYEEVAKGIRDVMEGNETRFSDDEAYTLMQTAYYEAQDKVAAENLIKEAAFLEENGKKTGVITTASGLQYEVVTMGSGLKPNYEDTVTVEYEGTLLDGTVFDSTSQVGYPAEIPLAQVIPGWAEGVQLMPVGSTFKFYIPSALAYGEQGGGTIAPNSMLVFSVELLSIAPPVPETYLDLDEWTSPEFVPAE
ncbi:MAG: FKBP-type peptidyl-prolyl cis-trans isomerase [Treponema sp.]|nr:FKBP-type peptidyl-prolyl cis-trans isomerase [Treponema sp.]